MPGLDLGLAGLEDLVEIGRGGFAVVYRARQPAFARTVAVKVLAGAFDEHARTRFERECQAIGALSGHPHIVTVHASGFTADGRPYIVMEYLAGGSLGGRLEERGPIPWREAVGIGSKLASALEVAHGSGVLHRDIKPENVLESARGEPKLADFGIARIEGGPETRSGIITATLAHVAPEILDGEPATARSDVYSLCSTLFAFLTGHAAFVRPQDESVVALIARIATEPVPELRTSGIPDEVCRLLEDGMSKDPNLRIPNAETLRQRLDASAARAGRTTVIVPHPPTEPRKGEAATPWRRRRAFVVGSAAVAIALAAGAVLVAGSHGNGGASSNAIAATVKVGTLPRGVAAGAGAIWVANGNDNSVSRIDPTTNSVAATVKVGGAPQGVAVGASAVWVTNENDNSVSRIDPSTNSVAATIKVGNKPGQIAAAAGSVWVDNFEDNTVSRIDPSTNSVAATIKVGAAPQGIAAGPGAVWTANSDANTVSRIDPSTNSVASTVEVGRRPVGLALDADAVWVPNYDDNTVSRIDPPTNSIAATIKVGRKPLVGAVGVGAFWVSNRGNNTVSRIDPRTNSVGATIKVGREPQGVVVGDGAVWVCNREDGTVSRIHP